MEQKQYEALCGFMEHLTKDYLWYYDTPEYRFEYRPESIWLINPKTKEWALELEKDGKLWWYWDFHLNFRRYFNMERSDFEKFIKVWVEDVLNRGMALTDGMEVFALDVVEDVLNRGVALTVSSSLPWNQSVENVLNRGITTNGKSRWKLWK